MIFNQTEKQEKEYLQQVITTIHDTINTTSTSVKEHIDTLQEYKDYLWSNKDIDPHEIRSMRESILNQFALGENVIDKRRRLSKILIRTDYETWGTPQDSSIQKYRRGNPRYCGFSKLLQELPLYLIRDHLQNRIPSKRTCSKVPDICKRHLTFVQSKFCLCERDYHHFRPYGERTGI